MDEGDLPADVVTKAKNFKIGDDVIYGIRPEEISITDNKDDNSLELIIKEIDFKGPNSMLHLIDKNKNLTIKVKNFKFIIFS